MPGTSHVFSSLRPHRASDYSHLTDGETEAPSLETTHVWPHASQEADPGLLHMGQV